MTLHDAAKAGIRDVRLPDWSRETYLRIDVLPDGTLGPLGHLHSYGEVHDFPHATTGVPCLKEWIAYEG